MTLRHLKIFVMVCNTGSVTEAAEKLYLAQPSVSLAISELENYYGVKLFDRISRRLYITDAGKNMLQYASHIVSLFNEMEQKIKNADEIGKLKIGSSITIGNYLIPRCIKEFSSLYPNIEIEVLIDNSENIEKKVLNNQIDIAAIEGGLHSTYLVNSNFYDDELVFICGRDHEFSGRKDVSVQELANSKFLMREGGSAGREMFNVIMQPYGVNIVPIWESTSTRAIIRGVNAGIGISVLPYLIVKEYLSSGEIRQFEVNGINISRKYSIIYHKNKYLSDSMLKFIAILKEQSEIEKISQNQRKG